MKEEDLKQILEESEGVNKLFDLIIKSPGRRVPFFEHKLNIPSKTIERWIKILKEENKIEFKGSFKTGGYFKK